MGVLNFVVFRRFIVVFLGGLQLDALLLNELIELFSLHLGDVQLFHDLVVLVQEEHFGGFSGHFFELGVFVLCHEVLVKEFLHFGQPVQTSSGATLHFALDDVARNRGAGQHDQAQNRG